MSNIKFGLKLWSKNYNLIGKAKKLIEERIFHYVELMVIPGTDISPFQGVKLPYIIHIPYEIFNVNIAEKEKEDISLEIINQNIKWADKLSAKYLILHPGFEEMETAKNFLEKINDKRILIENMPKVGIDNEKMIGYNLKQRN